MANQSEIDRLLEQADRLLRLAADLANEPEDDFHDGAILTWRRTFHEGGVTYRYVAVKVEGAFSGDWLVSGKTGYVSWSTLLRRHLLHADDGEVWWATEYTDPELT